MFQPQAHSEGLPAPSDRVSESRRQRCFELTIHGTGSRLSADMTTFMYNEVRKKVSCEAQLFACLLDKHQTCRASLLMIEGYLLWFPRSSVGTHAEPERKYEAVADVGMPVCIPTRERGNEAEHGNDDPGVRKIILNQILSFFQIFRRLAQYDFQRKQLRILNPVRPEPSRRPQHERIPRTPTDFSGSRNPITSTELTLSLRASIKTTPQTPSPKY